MKVRVRNVAAKCVCDSSDFEAPHAPPFAPDDLFTCSRCERGWKYAELLDRIGEQASKQAKDAIERMRRNKPKKKPS